MNSNRAKALVVRRWIILAAVVTNLVLGVLVWLTLTVSGERRVITAALAVVPMLLLMLPLLGISFWARDRATRRLTQWMSPLTKRPPGQLEPATIPNPTDPPRGDQLAITGHRRSAS